MKIPKVIQNTKKQLSYGFRWCLVFPLFHPAGTIFCCPLVSSRAILKKYSASGEEETGLQRPEGQGQKVARPATIGGSKVAPQVAPQGDALRGPTVDGIYFANIYLRIF